MVLTFKRTMRGEGEKLVGKASQQFENLGREFRRTMMKKALQQTRQGATIFEREMNLLKGHK